jgi:uncharacterized protein Usg
MASKGLCLPMAGHGLTTANILYRLPDQSAIIQSYIWREYDLHPEFPEFRKFLDLWVRQLQGPLHAVIVTHFDLIKPAEMKLLDGEFWMH